MAASSLEAKSSALPAAAFCSWKRRSAGRGRRSAGRQQRRGERRQLGCSSPVVWRSEVGSGVAAVGVLALPNPSCERARSAPPEVVGLLRVRNMTDRQATRAAGCSTTEPREYVPKDADARWRLQLRSERRLDPLWLPKLATAHAAVLGSACWGGVGRSSNGPTRTLFSSALLLAARVAITPLLCCSLGAAMPALSAASCSRGAAMPALAAASCSRVQVPSWLHSKYQLTALRPRLAAHRPQPASSRVRGVSAAPAVTAQAVKQFSSFQSLIDESPEPVLVQFHATWCGPCLIMSQYISEVAR